MARQVRIRGGYVDLDRRIVVRHGVQGTLGPNETKLLSVLVGNAMVDVSRELLWGQVWGNQTTTWQGTLDTTVYRLRGSIEANPRRPELVVRSGGAYRYVPLDSDAVDGAPPVVPPLGVPATLFVGREAEMVAIAAAFDAGTCWVPLTGPAGVGKTRLALEFAGGSARPVTRETTFVDASAARSGDALIAHVARQMGVPAADDPAAAVGLALAGRGSVFLVLDNLEQVSAAAAQIIARWLQMAPSLRVLTTSRHRVPGTGATEIEVPPLPVDQALRMFMDRAEAAAPRSCQAPGARAAIADLVDRLDCLPLAIELAASRSRTLAPADLLRRLGRRIELLRRPGGSSAGRHDALETAISWSWDLLDPVERGVLGRCAVFEGGFDLDAAEAVLMDGAASDGCVLDHLDTLVSHSLVRAAPDGAGGTRYALYSAIRAFAASRLPGVGDRGQVELLHARHYAGWGSKLAERVRRGDSAALARLLVDVENLEVALSRRGDADLVLRLALVLDTVLSVCGPGGRNVAVLESVALSVGDADPSLHVRVLRALGIARRNAGDASRALGCLEEAVARAALLDDAPLMAACEASLANALAMLHRVDEAHHLLHGAWDRVRGLPGEEASVRCDLGNVLLRSGTQDAMEAEDHFGQALVLAQEADDLRIQARALTGLGLLRCRAERFAEAIPYHIREVEACRKLGEVRWMGSAISNLGRAAWEAGDLFRGEEWLREGLAIHRHTGNRLHEGVVMANLGLLLHERGDSAEADGLVVDALALASRLGESRQQAIAAVNLAWIRRERDCDSAVACCHRAEAAARVVGDGVLRAHALALRAALLADAGAAGDAMECLSTAAPHLGEAPVLPFHRAHVEVARCRAAARMAGTAPDLAAFHALIAEYSASGADVRIARAALRRVLGGLPGTAGEPPLEALLH